MAQKEIDARNISKRTHTICILKGRTKPDEHGDLTKCKNFIPSSRNKLVCMYYKSKLGWCDYVSPHDK
jgi:hypothetical protein